MYRHLKIILEYSFFLFPIFGFAQNCDLTLSGYVIDEGTDEPLAYVNILLMETQTGTISDSTGFFRLPNLCSGEFHLVLSHIGCESHKIFLRLNQDTTLNLTLEHSENLLHDVVIIGDLNKETTQHVESISEQKITDNSSENLSNLLESITGVSTLKNGAGISKPVVHGLYGNRITILNNGVVQSGQQWGNDHSPEIDPLVANTIQVIKGTAALEFMGANLGSVILVEPNKIEKEPHLHGRTSYFLDTNGWSNGVNLQLQQYSSKLAWKINGTLKKSGDKTTPDYFLRNTGAQEANFAIQLEKSFSEKLSTQLYFSSFNTDLGVLRGSHIGNLKDLQEAFQRTIPFFTEDNFSYTIEAPKQRVNHQLLKINTSYFVDETQWFNFTLAGQINSRKEFDVRRNERSIIPALSLEQYTLFAEGKYQKEMLGDLNLKFGIQYQVTDNTNIPETNIFPLIPDYRSFETGAYSILSKKINKSFFEIGLRYDNLLQSVVAITNSFPREIVRYNNVFHNFSGSGGWTYAFNKEFSLSTNVGYAMRNPAINELYSNGLHQGVSGIEEGSVDLETEKGLKTTLGIRKNIHEKLSLEVLGYYQRINDYIFLNPQEEIRQTIRGFFPVFKYEQTDAQIYGLDFLVKYYLSESLQTSLAYSFIQGDDLSNNNALINIPSNNIEGGITYAFSKPILLGTKKLENLEISWEHEYVFEQSNITIEQDYLLPPDAYYLMGLNLATDIQLSRTRLRLTASADNILNTNYRNYLNRQRYFADDLGRSIKLGVMVKF